MRDRCTSCENDVVLLAHFQMFCSFGFLTSFSIGKSTKTLRELGSVFMFECVMTEIGVHLS